MKNKKIETNYLYWINPQTKKRYPAGVAFHEEKFGEFRLKVDAYSGKRIFLKTIGSNGGQVAYRLEEAISHKGKLIRIEIGKGFSNSMAPESVFIEMAPNFDALLCLELKKHG